MSSKFRRIIRLVLADMSTSLYLIRQDMVNFVHFLSMKDERGLNVTLDLIEGGYLARGFTPMLAIVLTRNIGFDLDIPGPVVRRWFVEKWSKGVRRGLILDLSYKSRHPHGGENQDDVADVRSRN